MLITIIYNVIKQNELEVGNYMLLVSEVLFKYNYVYDNDKTSQWLTLHISNKHVV